MLHHSVEIRKPLGIVLEEIDELDPSKGVAVVKVLEDGNSATWNRMTLKENDSFCGDVVCLGDQIARVNGVKCVKYDDVMDLIASSAGDAVRLELARPEDNAVVKFLV